MISNVDWIALITIIAIVWVQIPYHNGSGYRALPAWLEYIGSKLIYASKNDKEKIESAGSIIAKVVFSLVWFTLYSLITATGYLIYTQPANVYQTNLMQSFYGLFLVNIILNKLWPTIFFGEYYFFPCTGKTVTPKKFSGKIEGVNTEFYIEKYNIPTALRVFFAGIIAFLIFATAASVLGVTAAMVHQDILTDTATVWVSLVTYSLYTIWTFLAIIMNVFVNYMVCIKEEELKILLPQ